MIDAQELPSGGRFAPSPLFGRDVEIDSVVGLLDAGARLVTLVGPGGIGKTRVALACGAATEGVAGMSVHVIGLAGVKSERILDEVGRAVDGSSMSLGIGEPLEHLAAVLAEGRHLLVLDTFEHLLQSSPLVEDLLARCPGLAALVTSRRRLGVVGERVVLIGPLSTADEGPAVRLFAARAHLAGAAKFDPAVLSSICVALHGSPLAIELAAARSQVMPTSVILAWLTGNGGRLALDLLSAPGSPSTGRHRSIRAVAEWSYALLKPDARTVLRQLAAFTAPMSLEDIEGVIGPNVLEGTAIDAVTELVESHLLQPAPAVADLAWFQLLDPLREFADERASAVGEQFENRQRHARWFRELARRAADGVEGSDEARWRRILDADRSNLSAAVDWLELHGTPGEALATAINLGPYWLHQGPVREGHETLDRLMRSSAPTADSSLTALATIWWARLTGEDGATGMAKHVAQARQALQGPTLTRQLRQADEHLAQLLLLDGDFAAAAATAEAMRDACVATHDFYGAATALILLSRAAQHTGDVDAAVTCAREALAIADRIGQVRVVARAEQALVELGATSGSRPALLAALAAYQAVGDLRGSVLACANLAIVASTDGDPADSARWFGRGLREAAALGYRQGEAFCVAGIVALAIGATRCLEAVSLHGSLSLAAPEAIRLAPPQSLQAYRDGIEHARLVLGDDAFAGALAAATPLWSRAVEQALTLGEDLASPTRPSHGSGHGLSERELEVLKQLAAGATNREIAALLYLSPKTVMHHASHIYRKLGVRSRAEAVDVAHTNGLLADPLVLRR